MTMGDPPSLSAIFPFLLRLFTDPAIIRAPAVVRYPLSLYISLKKLSTIRKRYKLIGGGSPMNYTTFMQAALLEKRLNEEGHFRVYIANRYSKPSTAQSYKLIKKDGIKEIVALPLYPHYSPAITGSSFKSLEDLMELDDDPPDVKWVRSISSDPAYATAFSAKVAEAIESFPPEERNEVNVLFSAHSLPHDFIKAGDPYLDEIQKSLELVLKIVNPAHFRLCFQSKGRAGMEWLKPETDAVMRELAAEGNDKVLLAPISFVSENIETLYDCDILYKKLASSLGITRFVRAKCMDEDPALIDALAGIVLKNLG